MLLALMLAAAAPAVTLREGAALTEQVRAADAKVFALVFDRCDPPALAAMIAPDFEMYHDKGGVVATNGPAFVADEAKSCAAWAKPNAWRSRRVLLPATLHVYPVPGFGAIEEGEHEFYERRGDGPEKLVGHARFVQLWRLTPDGWKLSRVFSYGHRPAG